jgi:hypothetical protein
MPSPTSVLLRERLGHRQRITVARRDCEELVSGEKRERGASGESEAFASTTPARLPSGLSTPPPRWKSPEP